MQIEDDWPQQRTERKSLSIQIGKRPIDGDVKKPDIGGVNNWHQDVLFHAHNNNTCQSTNNTIYNSISTTSTQYNYIWQLIDINDNVRQPEIRVSEWSASQVSSSACVFASCGRDGIGNWTVVSRSRERELLQTSILVYDRAGENDFFSCSVDGWSGKAEC